jgi:hypothetical protein
MFETYRMLGEQHEAELLRRAQRAQPKQGTSQKRAAKRRRATVMVVIAAMSVAVAAVLLQAASAYAATARLPTYERIRESTSSRFSAIVASESASRLRRKSGSVFDGRTLKCQSSKSTERPSRCEMRPPAAP